MCKCSTMCARVGGRTREGSTRRVTLSLSCSEQTACRPGGAAARRRCAPRRACTARVCTSVNRPRRASFSLTSISEKIDAGSLAGSIQNSGLASGSPLPGFWEKPKRRPTLHHICVAACYEQFQMTVCCTTTLTPNERQIPLFQLFVVDLALRQIVVYLLFCCWTSVVCWTFHVVC